MTGEPRGRIRISQPARRVGCLAIANISATLDPEVIILGGGVARSADLLVEPILQRIEGVVPFVPHLVASPLGRRAAVMGAIMLVLNITTESFAIKQLP